MIKGWLVGDRELVAHLKDAPPRMQDAVQRTVQRMALKLLAHVKGDKLSDQVLHVRTGRLRRSINQRVEETPTGAIGYVGTNVEYGARHEYGFHGTENVRSHLRHIKQAWGRQIKPTEVMVRAHTRKANTPERSFLRSALADMRAEIQAEMTRAMNKATP